MSVGECTPARFGVASSALNAPPRAPVLVLTRAENHARWVHDGVASSTSHEVAVAAPKWRRGFAVGDIGVRFVQSPANFGIEGVAREGRLNPRKKQTLARLNDLFNERVNVELRRFAERVIPEPSGQFLLEIEDGA